MAGLRGFAAMTPEQRRKVASKGGRAAHEKGVAHTWTKEEAAEAGRRGGTAMQRRAKQHKEEQQNEDEE